MVRLRPISVSSGSTEMQFDCTEQSPQPSQTAGLISTRRAGSSISPRLRRRRFFGRTGLHEDDGGGALHLAAGPLDGVEVVAMRGLDAGRDLGRRIEMRVFGNQIDFADAFRVQLEGNLLRR